MRLKCKLFVSTEIDYYHVNYRNARILIVGHEFVIIMISL